MVSKLVLAFLSAACVLAVTDPARADAATVAVTSRTQGGEAVDTIVFWAVSGESNDVTATATDNDNGGAWLIHDSGAVLVAAAPCQSIDQHTVGCAADPEHYLNGARFELGDLDDRLQTVTPPGEADEGLGVIGEFWANGGPGNDRLNGDSYLNGLSGGDGDDELRVSRRILEGTLEGGPGDDLLWAGRTDTSLNGGGGRDAMYGGNDMSDGDREGAAGDAGPGPDLFDATAGRGGLVSYQGRHAPIRVDLRRGVGGQAGEGDVLKGVRQVEGGSGDDVLLGDDEPNRLLGRRGFDRLSGRGGNDTLFPDRGGSRVSCGAGTDTSSRPSTKDWLASDCETAAWVPARPTLTATGSLRYTVPCEERADDDESFIGECSAWLHVWQTGPHGRLLAKGATPLGHFHKRTFTIMLTAAGRRLAARRHTVTATLKLHIGQDGSHVRLRWTTRLALTR